jgi:hypothetical protein
MPMILVKAFALLGLGLLSISVLSAQENGWINMFDQKTLKGWKANENPESWSAKDGTIVGDGREAISSGWIANARTASSKLT